MTPTTPWSIRAWPPVLWQAGRESQLRFHHLSTRVTLPGDRMSRGRPDHLGRAVRRRRSRRRLGLGADRRRRGGDGRPDVGRHQPASGRRRGRSADRAGVARFLNEIVHALPWQSEVQRALHVVPRLNRQGPPPFDRQARVTPDRYFTRRSAQAARHEGQAQRREQRAHRQRQRPVPRRRSARPSAHGPSA